MFLEQKNSGVFSPRSMTDLVSDSWPPRLRDLCRRGDSEIARARGDGFKGAAPSRHDGTEVYLNS